MDRNVMYITIIIFFIILIPIIVYILKFKRENFGGAHFMLLDRKDKQQCYRTCERYKLGLVKDGADSTGLTNFMYNNCMFACGFTDF